MLQRLNSENEVEPLPTTSPVHQENTQPSPTILESEDTTSIVGNTQESTEEAKDTIFQRVSRKWRGAMNWFTMELHYASHWKWQLRQRAGKWNSALDHSVFWSLAAWVIGTTANFAVFLAVKKDYADSLAMHPTWLEHHKTYPFVLLCISPLLGGIKKVLKLIEVRDDHAQAELLSEALAAIKRCALKLPKIYEQHSVTNRRNVSRRESLIAEEVAAHLAITFAGIASLRVEDLKVLVVKVNNGKLDAIIARAPEGAPAHSTVAELSKPGTCFSHCIETKELVVIPDLALELRKGDDAHFVVSDKNPSGGEGALICFPVVGGNTGENVNYVISVYSRVKRSFDPADNHFYNMVMNVYGAMLLCNDAHSSAGAVKQKVKQ